jgi:Holliday junction resolvase
LYTIIRGEGDQANWLVVEWKLGRKDIPMELTRYRYERAENVVRFAMSLGGANVVAYCKRREDARILAKELRRREQQECEWKTHLHNIPK